MRYIICLCFGILPGVMWGQLTLVPEPDIQTLFATESSKLKVVFNNAKNEVVKTKLSTRVYQKSSATLMPIGEPQPWKELTVLEGQTIMEILPMTFPEIKVPTRFQVHVLGEQEVVGKVEVEVYPADFFKKFRTLMGESRLGLFDPDNKLKPLFSKNRIEFEDLEVGSGPDTFQGKLAIFGIFPSKQPTPQGFEERVKQMVKRGVAVIWIRQSNHGLSPSLTVVLREENRSGVIIKTDEPINPAEPSAQKTLLNLAEIALNPDSIVESLIQ